jgi:hypothetical protein
VNAQGFVATARQALSNDAYETFFLGGGNVPMAATPAVGVVVTNHLKTTSYPISTVKAQPVFSNLESRRR